MTQHSAAAQEHQSRFSWAVAPSDCHQLHQISSTSDLKTSSLFTWFLPHKNLRWNDYCWQVPYISTAVLVVLRYHGSTVTSTVLIPWKKYRAVCVCAHRSFFTVRDFRRVL